VAKDRAMIERQRQEYIDHFLKQLP
jgi:hypothetical protein